MFCSNCGKEVSANAKFCDNCGAPVAQPTPPATPAQPVVPTQPAQPVAPAQPVVQPTQPVVPAQSAVQYTQPGSKKKKGKGGLIVLFIVLGLFVIGFIVNIVQTVKENNTPSDYSYNYDLALEDEDKAPVENPEYMEVFTSRNIIDTPALFMTEETSAVVNVDDEGMIEKIEFGHEDDIILEMCDTIYYPISGFSDAQIEAIDEAMRDTMSKADELSFCTVSYTTTDDYYIVTINSKDLDNALNLQSLSDAGVLGYDGFATSLSLKETVKNFIDQGYITKYTVEE